MDEGQENTKIKEKKASPSPDTQGKLLPKIDKGLSETALPMMSNKRIGKHNRVYSNKLTVIAERSPKQTKKVNTI